MKKHQIQIPGNFTGVLIVNTDDFMLCFLTDFFSRSFWMSSSTAYTLSPITLVLVF